MDPLQAKFVWFIYKGQPIKDVPKDITHLLIDPSVDEIEDDSFNDCKDLLSVVVPTTVKRIGKRAFFGCNFLSDVQLHEGLESIGDNAFGSCVALESVQIPYGVLSIGNGAFGWCEALDSISLPSSIQWIGSSAFYRCALVQVHLHQGIKSIGYKAFEFCKKLVDINLPEGLEWIDFRTFGGCDSLCTISMPSTMNKIGWNAFEECISLVHVHLNEGLRCIGTRAFSHCTALSAIALPSSLEEIESLAFQHSIGLVGFEIPGDSTVAIPKDCFDCSRSLVNVSIPPSVDDWCLRLIRKRMILFARNRYDHLPIHSLCYNPTRNTTTEKLTKALASPGILEDGKLKDACEMTPFHIVATSSNLRADILECLLDSYPTDLLWESDYQGHTMMDYLFKNKSSKAFHLMGMVIYKFFLGDEMCSWDIQGRDNLFELLDDSSVIRCHDDKTRRTLLEEMLGHVGYYYRIETRSIMELAIWKMKIDELQVDSGNSDFIDRASCRYRFGVEDVVKSVIGYLWDGESSTYSTAISAYPKLDFYKVDPDPDFEGSESGSWSETEQDSDESSSSSSE